ncbi:MAG TPA: hypothetical protein VHZ25_14545 [Acidobacteriaceae bacterium]|jgi:hypothetical protein|nr:hypothetical protein [Acidobacteriaceae bacterium]
MPTAPALHPPPRNGIAVNDPPQLPIPATLAPILLTPLVLLIHGYHPFAGDAGIYVAGVRHLLDPALYPINAVFPAAFTRLSVFPWTLAALVHFLHLPLSWILLAAHLLSIFLFLSACRQLAMRLFTHELAIWSCVALAAACFTLPIAGTALFVMDPYVTARSFSTPLSLMAITASIDRAWLRTGLLLALAALIHPLMAAYAVAFVVLYALIASGRVRVALSLCATVTAVCGLVFALAHGAAIDPAYRQAVSLPPRTFLFLARWHRYELLGLALPLLLFALALRSFGRATRKGALCLTCLLLGVTSVVIAAVFVPPAGPYPLVPLQVLRSFQLIYLSGIILSGGILARLAARSRFAAISLLVLLCAGMFAAQRFAWTGSNVEWPGARPANPWQQAFLWIRDNTPRSTVFALNPQLVYLPEEDEQGFRAIAERDHLADDKDAGIVAVLPQLADRWARQHNAEFDVDGMTDAERLNRLGVFGVTWLLLPPDAATGLPCPYGNNVVKVCEMRP